MFDLNGDGDVDAEEFEQVFPSIVFPQIGCGTERCIFRDSGAGDYPAIDLDGEEAPRARQYGQHHQGQEDELGTRHVLLR